MCLLAISVEMFSAAPLAVAANREEAYRRAATPPTIGPERPRVLCGSDLAAGGTWLGVNQHGLVVAVTNRWREAVPPEPRSRGLLCRDLLKLASAEEARRMAQAELASSAYAGGNFLCADPASSWVVSSGHEIQCQRLAPGLHLLTNGDLNDPRDPRQALARRMLEAADPQSIDDYLQAAATVCGTRGSLDSQETIVIRGPERGTVSSTILALAKSPAGGRYWYADGPPDQVRYQDLSTLLHATLSED